MNRLMPKTYISDIPAYFVSNTPEPLTTASVPNKSSGLSNSLIQSNSPSSNPSNISPKNKEMIAMPRLPQSSVQ